MKHLSLYQKSRPLSSQPTPLIGWHSTSDLLTLALETCQKVPPSVSPKNAHLKLHTPGV